MMSQSLNNGTRRSTRDKKKPDHYGSFADPPKARKKSQKSNPTAANEDDVVDVKSASSSIKSSVRKMEIECKKDRALQDIGDQHRQARKDHAEAEIQVTSLNKEMESLKVQVQELQQDSSAVDRDVKISELQKQQLDTNSKIRAAEKEVALKKLDLDIATEAHESMKQIIIKGAVYEKRKADLEEEDSERKRSIEDLALIDKEKATKKWAANVDAVFYSENSTSESEEELSDDDTPPYQPHRSTTMKPQSTSQKILARQIRGRDLPPFSRGQEWPAFILAFESSTTNCQFTEGENLIRLQRSLKGEALELVQCLLVDPRGVRIAIDKLRKRFGRPGIIIKTMMQKLQQIPNVKTDNYESWVKLGTGVDNLVSTIKSLGAKQQLSNPSLVDELVKKLPAQKAMEWEEFKLRKKLEFPSLSHLAKWLQPTVEAAYALCPLPGTSTEKLSTDKPNHDNRRPPANQRGVRKNDRVMVTTEKNEARQAQSNQRGTERKCHFCNGSHGQRHCPKFKEADVNMRWAMVKEKRCCIGCLNRGHRMHECRSKRVCGIEGCQQTHCQLLHNRNARNSEESSHITEQQRNQSSEQEVALSAVSGRSNSNINYNVIPIYAKRRDGQLLPMYMVLDGYASLTSADDSIRQQLNVDGRRRPLTVQGFQSTTTTPNSYEVDIEIVSRLDGKSYTLRNVRTVPKLDLPSQSLTKETLKRFSHIEGTPILTYQNVVPTILVGMDNFELHLPEEMKIGRVGEPAAIRTAMGWALVGPTASPPKKLHHAFHINDRQDDPLHQLVKQFFTTEYVGVKPNLEKPRSRDDIKAQVIMDQTIRRVSHGWESGLLWRDEDVKLPCNKNYAFQRQKSMEKKMDQDPEFARQYVERIQEYQDKGFAKILPPEKAAIETSRTFYLPHFMAYNAKKPKKYRFVFDAAAKVYGKSLNDHLLQGPDKLVSLPGALFKFRQRRIGVTGDIKDMFHRIKIREEDASAQRFLWRGMDRDRDPDVMEMGVLIFGASCSPACAQEAKNKNAEQFKEEFPDAYKAIVHRHYMDDLLDSYDTEAQAIQMQKDIFEVHRRGSFHICYWLSNSPEVMKAIPAELQSKTSQSLDINKEDQIERALGLFWMPEEDNFTFCLKYLKVSEDVMKGRRIPTKREVLSLVMSVFDPLGFLSTLTIKAKMILQRTWISEIGWDDEIPSSTHQAWKLWLTLLESITEFKVPRCYSPTFSRSTDNQLHIFGDGSEEAFGVVAYFRIAHGSQVTTALVMAKANVAPIKHLTIPRMELQAAVIAARLAKFIQDHHEVDIHKTVFWSDSQTVLDWIRADGKRYQQFVASRIGEIHELTDASQWRWIPTKENPADELTRMSSNCDWTSQSRWINGPEFLKLEENLWPIQKRTSKNEMTAEAELELKKEQILQIAEKRKCSLDASNFSSWTRLIRVTAYILRFIAKIRKVPSRTGALFPSELRAAQVYWNRVAQMESFPDEVAALKNGTSLPNKNILTGLSVKLDAGLLRVAGRLENANLPFRQRRPIVLSRHHPYVKLLVQYFHEICGHHGQERICNEIRQQYHVIGIRTAVRAAQSRCQSCKNRRAVPVPPEMGQLPKFRVKNPRYPFNMTGLDYFGPIQVTVKRSTEKRYVALFTCLATRAVHLEVAGSLSTDSCIMALRRFCARRGSPAAIYSDNGTNFHGAKNELKLAMQELNQEKLKSSCATKGIEWYFNPPSASHFGGSWERMVRSVKIALGDTLLLKNLSEEVLNTVLAEAEHSVNSHPLTHVPVDPMDPDVLTPNHFLISRSSNLQPIGSFDRHDLFGRKQWRCVQVMADNFWKKWTKEYRPTLLRRHKWCQTTKPIKVGDVILEVNDNLPRNTWPMGRVIKLYPGKDDVIRVVDIILANGNLYRRPVAKLCILDVDEEKTATTQSSTNVNNYTDGRMLSP